MKHIPRKRFGQHFLTDQGVIDEIIHAIAPRPGDYLVEIGPGLGALTQPLLERSGGVTVIELDRDLVAHWRSREGVTVIDSDVLKVPLTRIRAALNATQQKAKDTAPTIRLVGNLPYNISTPILFHFLPMAQQIVDQHFMLQLEVVERMVAEPATSAYGRLSVMLQWRYEMDNFLRVLPEAFDPAPRVHSAVVRMKPRAKPEPLKPEWLEQLVQVAFSQRRKLLRHTLGRWLDVHQFSGDFDLHRRAEEVPVDEYVALAQHMTHTAPATGP